MNGPHPWDLGEAGPGLPDHGDDAPVHSGDVPIQPGQLTEALPDELSPDRSVSSDQGSRSGPMHLGSEVGHLPPVPGTDVQQIGMGPVGHLGPGSNQLVAVVDERPEVGQHLHPVGRRQDLPAGHDPGHRHRVDQVRLALGPSPPSLPVGQGGRYLPDVFPGTQEKPRERRSS
jgi:hypothetical protein